MWSICTGGGPMAEARHPVAAEWDRDQQALVDRVSDVLSEHLPNVVLAESRNEFWQQARDTIEICGAAFEETTSSGPWDATAEAAKVDKLRGLAQQFSETWASLHPQVLQAMKEAAAQRGANHTAQRVVFDADALPERLGSALDAGLAAARQGSSTRADRDWQAVGVVDVARRIWHRRSGKSAPATLNPESPFARFLADLFFALKMDTCDPVTAMRAWQKTGCKPMK